MTETEAAYIAGLIDGEGSIMLINRGDRNTNKTPIVSMASTDLDLLEWLKGTVGGVICVKRQRQAHHKPASDWRLVGRHVFGFLDEIYPYLRIQRKRARADLILKDYLSVTPRNGKYTEDEHRAKLDFEERFAAL